MIGKFLLEMVYVFGCMVGVFGICFILHLFFTMFSKKGDKKLFIAIDVSGSLRGDLFGKIKSMVKSLFGNKSCDLILFDQEIQKIYKDFNDFDKLELIGRGGTDFGVIIDYIEEEANGKKVQLVIVTDGYGAWRKIDENIELTIILTEDIDTSCMKDLIADAKNILILK